MQHQQAKNTIEFYLLGQFHIRLSGYDVPHSNIQGRKARALLKLLALSPHHQIIRDRAMDLLWPDLNSSAAAAQLYKAIHNVRKGLGKDEWLEITDELIRISVPGVITTDIKLFEQSARQGLKNNRPRELEDAVSLYAGDLLPMDLYEEWTQQSREHYRQLYIDVMLTLAEIYERHGELSEAAELLRLTLEKDPALESAHRGLMRIFAIQGQVNRALRQYQLCHEVFEKELGISPSAEMEIMQKEIREGRFKTEIMPSMFNENSPGPVSPIIGRETDCIKIEQALHQLETGIGKIIAISGPMGIGKTRIAQEVALRARRCKFSVFSINVQETESATSYGPFAGLMEKAYLEDHSLKDLIPYEIGRLMPEYTSSNEPIPNADRLAARGILFAQIYQFFKYLSTKKPLVLILEDLHTADQGSIDLFQYLSRQIEKIPVLLVATIRTHGSLKPMDLNMQSTQDANPWILLEPKPLTKDQHYNLLLQERGSNVSKETADRIFNQTEGNPLFAKELHRFYSDQSSNIPNGQNATYSPSHHPGVIPSSLQYLIEKKLQESSPSVRHLLYLAAVIGRQIPYNLIVAAWNDPHGDRPATDENLFDLLDAAFKGDLLEERGLVYYFRHALFREAIYQSISEPRRRALHALIARQLIESSLETNSKPVEKIGYHYIHAGDTKQAVHYLLLAGEHAEGIYAHEDALRLYGKAIGLLEGEDNKVRRTKMNLYERVGDVYRSCGRLEQSYEAYEKAVKLIMDIPMNKPDLVELYRKIALVAIFRTEMDKSEKYLVQAFDLVADETSKARLLIIKALQQWHFNKLEEACDIAHKALALAEAHDSKSIASQACEILAMTYLPLGQWEKGLDYEMRRQLYGWSPEIVVATDAHLCLWEYHVGGNQPFHHARDFLNGVAEKAGEMGDLRCVAVCHYALGTMHLWRGEKDRAVEQLNASLRLHESVGSPAGMAYALARMGVMHTMSGALELGWQAIQEGIDYSNQASVRDHCLQRLYGVGIWNRIEADDPEGVLQLVTQSENLLAETPACAVCALELYPWLSYYYLKSGAIQQAQEYASMVDGISSISGNPLGQAIVSMIESNIQAAQANKNAARQLQGEAFQHIEPLISQSSKAPIVRFLDLMAGQQDGL